VEPTKAAYKIIDILADNRILPAQWKFYVPIFIVQQPRPVVSNARNLAEGILEGIDKYGVEIPPWKFASHEGSQDYGMDEDWQ